MVCRLFCAKALSVVLLMFSGLPNSLGEHHGVWLQRPAENRRVPLIHMAVCTWYFPPFLNTFFFSLKPLHSFTASPTTPMIKHCCLKYPKWRFVPTKPPHTHTFCGYQWSREICKLLEDPVVCQFHKHSWLTDKISGWFFHLFILWTKPQRKHFTCLFFSQRWQKRPVEPNGNSREEPQCGQCRRASHSLPQHSATPSLLPSTRQGTLSWEVLLGLTVNHWSLMFKYISFFFSDHWHGEKRWYGFHL